MSSIYLSARSAWAVELAAKALASSLSPAERQAAEQLRHLLRQARKAKRVYIYRGRL